MTIDPPAVQPPWTSDLPALLVEVASSLRRIADALDRHPLLAPAATVAPLPPRVDVIIEAVGRYYGVPATSICGTSRLASVTRTRHVAFYLAHLLSGRSSAEIGSHFGNRDHTTVLHGVRRIAREIETGNELGRQVMAIRAKGFADESKSAR